MAACPSCNTQNFDHLSYCSNCGGELPVAQREPESIQSILESVGLVEYLDFFHENHVDLNVFITLTEEDMKSIGIASLGHRKQISSAIDKYRPRSASNTPPAFQVNADLYQDEHAAYQSSTNKIVLPIAVLCMLSMFLPWAGSGPFSISGWNVTAFATHGSALAYLLYVFPVGAGTVFYSVMNNKPVPTWARLAGLIPFVLTFGALFKNGVGHLSFGQIIEMYFKYVLPGLGIGFWLALACGFLLFLVPRGSQY